MEYTDEERQRFKDRYAARWRRQIIVSMPLYLLIIGLGMMVDDGPLLLFGSTVLTDIVVIVFFASLVGVPIFTLINWRCPACNAYLGVAFHPGSCRKCGIALR